MTLVDQPTFPTNHQFLDCNHLLHENVYIHTFIKKNYIYTYNILKSLEYKHMHYISNMNI